MSFAINENDLSNIMYTITHFSDTMKLLFACPSHFLTSGPDGNHCQDICRNMYIMIMCISLR